jgi:outer membrane protein assembly factor BamB/tRNA A-37 threonylcarbamoyl transferase component Bud32
MPNEANDSAVREQRLHEVLLGYMQAVDAGQEPDRGELLAQYPDLAAELASFFAGQDQVRQLAEPLRQAAPAAGNELPTSPPRETPADQPPSGVRAFGDYELLEEVARGGMGVVYKARQRSLNRVVALKMILAGQLATEEDVQRFYAEAQMAANLQHPNIVSIHEVGEHDGQHFFSMDFVEGWSLAELVRENPLPPAQAARYVQTVAEAIHYAHQQGVLHRDLKPANVLIDPFAQPRVTDFGLAKRLGQAGGQTITGAIVGTPSYMPPEQAAGERDKLGPASDVYSLGAVLYELVTGRPPFRAANLMDTLRQVLEAEPAPPRLLNPSVSRDLETIILKCLAKQPGRRYASAEELANDLKAFREGRPIQARRAGWAERALRWLRKQRRSAVLTAVTAAVSVVLVLAALLAWRWYTAWRQGSFALTSEDVALEAEVLDQQGEPVLPAFTVPARPPVALPGGAYRVRLSWPGRLSETYGLLVEQGLHRSFAVGPDDRRLGAPLAVPLGHEVVDLGGRPDVVIVTEKGMRRVNVATGRDVWPGGERSLAKEDQPRVAQTAGYDWDKLRQEGWPGETDELAIPPRPWLVRPAPDLDGDGTRYLVWASQRSPWLLAVSGKDGTVKWWFSSQRFPKERADPVRKVAVGCPPLITDVDGDGCPDLVAVFGELRGRGRPRWVEAISGRTGQSLWHFAFDPLNGPPPQVGYFVQNLFYTATVIQAGGKKVVAVVAGRHLVGLDLRGKVVWPVRDLGFLPATTPLFVDLSGKGQPALLLVEEEGADFTLKATSLTGKLLWVHPVGRTANHFGGLKPPLGWPLVADLTKDGKPAIIVPFHNTSPDGWVGIKVLDGATGKSRWRSRLGRANGGSAEPSGPAHFLVGPDLDGDGCPDVFSVASLRGEEFGQATPSVSRLLVAAVSGADGRLLWRRHQTLREITSWFPQTLTAGLWEQPGPNGPARLVVTSVGFQGGEFLKTRPTARDRIAQTFVFSASTGSLEHLVPGLSDVGAADFNSDGLPDLYGLRRKGTGEPAELYAFRGTPPEAWRRLGTWQPAITGDSPANSNFTPLVAPPLPHGDLDGDGVADFLVFRPTRFDRPPESPLRAYSGKDGRWLWSAKDIQGTLPSPEISECFLLQCRDLEGKGQPAVLFGFIVGTRSGSPSEVWLAALNASTGKPLWKVQLEGKGGNSSTVEFVTRQAPGLADVNGDGVLDLLVSVATGSGVELQARDGRNGQLLWRQPLLGATIPVTVTKPARNGTVDVIGTSAGELVAVDGREGKLKWRWAIPKQLDLDFEPRRLVGSEFKLRPPLTLADLDGKGRPSTCFLAWNRQGDKLQLIILDHRGQFRKPVPILTRPKGRDAVRLLGREFDDLPLWSHDLKGDGKEELLLVSGGKVRALGGKFAKPLWEWPLPGGKGTILDVQPAGKSLPAMVIVQAGSQVYGLEGPTGRPRWRCDGPGRPVAVWPPERPGGLPGIVYHLAQEDSTVCRQLLAVDRTGKYVLPETALGAPGSPQEETYWRVSPRWQEKGRVRG